MARTTLLALALALGGGAPYLGGFADALQMMWAAGAHFDPNGSTTDAGGMYDPNGASAESVAGGHADPAGTTTDVGGMLDPNG